MVDVLIRQADKRDTWDIASFLGDANLVHKHLDWKDVLDWVEEKPFLLYFEDDKLCALLSCAPDPPGVNWIHCFASLHTSGAEYRFQSLVRETRSPADHEDIHLASVGLQDWFTSMLRRAQFTLQQNIVVLAWNGIVLDPIKPVRSILIRPMEISDLEQVHEIDTLAFEPLWRVSPTGLYKAYQLAEHANVAEIGERIIGYELSTANHFSAHLARLAVHPEFTRSRIGAGLVWEMLVHYIQNGIHKVTVNTQDNNRASLALYEKMNFIPTGDTFPVFTRTVL